MAYAQPHLSPSLDAQSKRPDLRLSNMPLPRFHPANFPAPNSSSSNMSTPSTLGTPAPPLSPRLLTSPYAPGYTSNARTHNDAPRALYSHRETFSMLHPGAYSPLRQSPTGSFRVSRPTSPRLDPLGSPGPVTPLELEDEQDGYLFGSAAVSNTDGKPLSDKAKDDVVESYIRRESALARHPAEQRHTLSPRSSHVGIKRGDVTRHRSNLSR